MKKTIKVATLNWNPKGSYNVLGYYTDFENSSIYKILEKNYNIEFSQDPDYVFCYAKFFEPLKFPNAVRILCSGENHKPNFNIYDYAVTLFSDYQYEDRCFFLPGNCLFNQYKIHDRCTVKHKYVQKYIDDKTEFCSFVVSNGSVADDRRESFFHLLSKYKKVNSGGKFLNNIDTVVENKFEFEKKHKFAITFENTPNYVTEKIEDAFAAGTVPIYWGDPNVTKLYNSKAFINCHEYSTFEEVVQEVIRIDNDDEKYLKMLSEPAYLNPKMSQEYLEDLEKFMVKIIERPKELAIQRNVYGQQKTLEDIMYLGYQQYIKTAKRKMVLYRFTKYLNVKKIIQKIMQRLKQIGSNSVKE